MKLPGFPEDAAATIAGSAVAEMATLTKAGVPLDTPLLSWVSPDGTTIDLSTGLSYPAKAERARRRPTVGLCFGDVDARPLVAVAAIASVRDRDIQRNAERYASLTGPMIAQLGRGRPWSELRQAVWYFARIWIECAPVRVLWWPDGAEHPARVWRRPGSTIQPSSDAPPAGKPTKPPAWPVRDWRPSAEAVVADLPLPYLTAVDPEGFPIPFPITGAELDGDGFWLKVPAGAPWDLTGPASLCFDGRATFVGSLEGSKLTVERQLPDLPLVADTRQIFSPQPDVASALMTRLQTELDRRGQPLPVLPGTPPAGFSSSRSDT
jgi:hypothetical protein